MLIKSRGASGNRVTKEIVQKIVQKEVGGSTLAARKIWFDTVVGRLNDEGRGKFLGAFKGTDRILTLYKNGEYRLSSFDLATHFDEDMIHIEKWSQDRAISTAYYDAEKDMHYVKRFVCEIMTDKRVSFISESEGSSMHAVSTSYRPELKIVYNKLLKETKNLPDNIVNIADLIEVKGMKAQGNQLTKLKVKEIVLTHEIDGGEPWPEEVIVESPAVDTISDEDAPTIEWDLTNDKKSDDDDPQISIFDVIE
jgi:topoisomerase-4 subunit A